MFFWYTLLTNTDGSLRKGADEKLHKPKLESGKKLPEDRVLDSGDVMNDLIVHPKKTITAAEINRLAFPDQVVATSFLQIAIKRIAAPKPKEPEPPPTADDSLEFSLSDDAQFVTWFVYVAQGSKAVEACVEQLPKGCVLATEQDYLDAQNGTFPSSRLIKVAFESHADRKKFAEAYRAGRKKS